MPSPSPWQLDVGLFIQSRTRWIERDRPDEEMVKAVNDWALDVLLDPTTRGTPDPEVDGVYNGWPGRGVIVLYGLNTDDMTVSVWEIGSDPSPRR